MSETLKPCPWCEEPSDIVFVRTSAKYGKMWCNTCGATGPASFSAGDGDDERSPPAIAAWNTRSHPHVAQTDSLTGDELKDQNDE